MILEQALLQKLSELRHNNNKLIIEMKEIDKEYAEKNWQEYFLENYGLHIFPAFSPEKEICVWNDSTLRIHKKNKYKDIKLRLNTIAVAIIEAKKRYFSDCSFIKIIL